MFGFHRTHRITFFAVQICIGINPPHFSMLLPNFYISVKENYSSIINTAIINNCERPKDNFIQNLFKPSLFKVPAAIPGKKTLVLDLDETLIHSSTFPPHPDVESFQNSQGLYIHLRPGLKEFLNFAMQNYEVFIFTYGEKHYANEIIDQICPELEDNHKLFRENCSILHGKIIKNLKLLKRKFDNIILIDDNSDCTNKFKNNSIPISPWKGASTDRTLKNIEDDILIKCLEVNDVRTVIKRELGE